MQLPPYVGLSNLFSEATRGGRKNIIALVPCFKRESAGIVSYHGILSWLMKTRFNLFCILEPFTIDILGYHPSCSSRLFNLPRLDRGTTFRFFQNEEPFITIYSDAVSGNPLCVSKYVRFVNYFYGDLAHNIPNPKSEFLVFFGDEIEKHFFKKYPNFPKSQTFNLSFPARSLEEIERINKNNKKRNKELYYANKSVDVFGVQVPQLIKNRADPLTMAPENGKYVDSEILNQLKETRCIHVFEETATIYEALLCGAVVNKHPDGVFKERPIGKIGEAGIIRSYNPTSREIDEASKHLDEAYIDFRKWWVQADKQVQKFPEFLDQAMGHSLDQLQSINSSIDKSNNLQRKLHRRWTTKAFYITNIWRFAKLILPTKVVTMIKKHKKMIISDV